ncbi:TIGR00270 family protein [Candidatus Woesearchaeota archaeon]|nr:TIGR00270 family protein [Candidatus Woesearchaeota archaeon]
MCGTEAELARAEIEGTILSVCNNCSGFGKVFGMVRPEPIPERKPVIRVEPPVEKVVADFSEQIRKKREELGLTQKDFSRRINQKESLVRKMESHGFEPDLILARHLEKALGLRLIEVEKAEAEPISSTETGGYTLGDFIKIRKK